MQQEVKENKRFKISDRSVSSDKLFANPKLTPTVGAGGQYSVTPQKPQQSSWERLAEGLGSMMGAAGAIQQSTVAANEASEKVVGEMTDREFQDAVAKAQEAQDVEKGMFDAGKFVDKLTRTGSASIAENPLTYTRGLQAAGLRVGREEYAPLVEQRLMDARKNMAANPDASYSIEQIQGEVKQELMDKYGMEGTFSMQRGFEKAISSEMKAQKIRDINEKDRLQKVRREGESSIAIGVAMDKMVGADSATRKEIMKDLNMQLNDLPTAAIIKASAKVVRDAELDSPETLSEMQKIFAEDGNKLGGYPLNSPVFSSVRTLMNDLQERAEGKVIRDNNKEKVDLQRGMDADVNAIRNVTNNTFADTGIKPVEGLDMNRVYDDKQTMLNDYRNAVMANIPKGKNHLYSDVVYSEVDATEDQIKNRKESEVKVQAGIDLSVAKQLASTDMFNFKQEVGKGTREAIARDDLPSLRAHQSADQHFTDSLLNIQRDLEDGVMPEGIVLPKNSQGEEESWDSMSDKSRQRALSDLIKKREYEARSILGEGLGEKDAIDRRDIDDDYKALEEKAKGSSFKSNYKAMEIPSRVKRGFGLDDYIDFHVANAASGNPESRSHLKSKDQQEKLSKAIDVSLDVLKHKKIYTDEYIGRFGLDEGDFPDRIIASSDIWTDKSNKKLNVRIWGDDKEKINDFVVNAKKHYSYSFDDFSNLTDNGYFTPSGKLHGWTLSKAEVGEMYVDISDQPDRDKAKAEVIKSIQRFVPSYDEKDFERVQRAYEE